MSSTMQPGLQRGPIEGPGIIGIDREPEQLPGVPMEAEPQPDPGAHWRRPEPQPASPAQLRRMGLPRVTPVFGTAQPPRGLSGLMRRLAYHIPAHKARHWAMLFAADRVDVMEGRIGRTLAKPLRNTPLERFSHPVENNPMRVIGAMLVGAWVVRRLMR